MMDTAWRNARRILVVRLDNLGDVLVTTPAIHAIRESVPHARINLLTSPVGAQVGRLNSDIDEVMVYEAPWMDPWSRLPLEPEREQAMIRRVSDGRFEAAIIFTSFRQSSLPAAYLCYLAGIPLRAAASIDGPGSLLTTRHKHPERLMHEVERGLDLVSALGMSTGHTAMVLDAPQEDVQRAQILRAQWCRADEPLVLLHPGCSMPARTYPWEQYAAAADLLIDQLGVRVVFTGAEHERDLVDRILQRMCCTAIDLSGQVSFSLFCALIQSADLTITNNTGPMHMAAALGTPVISLFALTNPPEQWGPWGVPFRQLYHDVPCRICYARICPVGHECLRLVTPQQVVDAAAELLRETSTHGTSVLPVGKVG